MARFLHSRLKITGTLTAETPLHVGGHGDSPDTDLPLAINGRGECYIPGTSLTGSIRAWCERNFGTAARGRQLVSDLFGPIQTKGDTQGHASFVIVEDIALPKNIQKELRDGVGIDRFYGSAAEYAKFDRAILPRLTSLNFAATVEIGERKRKPRDQRKEPSDVYEEDDAAFDKRINATKSLIGHLLSAIQAGELRFGAARTRGLGRVKSDGFEVVEQKLNIKNGVLDLLQGKGQTLSVQSLQAQPSNIQLSPNLSLVIHIEWHPKSSVMVKAGYDGIGVDTLPLTSGNGVGKLSLVMPGSSIKGAFRAQAERIVRTLKPDKFPTSPRKEFHEQIKVDVVNELFGAKKERPRENESESKRRLGRGALSIDDCYFGKQMNADDWRALELGKTTTTVKDKDESSREVDVSYTEQELWKAIKKIEGSEDLISPTADFAISHHVAIDRWTGGAADGALYSVLQPTARTGWGGISLTLDLSPFRDENGNQNEAIEKRCLMLLLLVLRDFAENRLPVGFATNRGMGEVEGVSFTTSGAYDIEWKDGQFNFKGNANLKSELEEEWRKWLKEN